jgi:transposase
MFSLLERHTVQQLSQMGFTQKAIREATGVSQRTIRRIQREPPVTNTDEESFRESRNVGRPSSVEQHEETIRQWLEKPRKPEDGPLKSSEIFTRLKALGYEGGKPAIYDLVRRLRPLETKPPLVRFEGLPGEFSQHDFGQRRVSFEDGTTQIVHFFASRLKYSRMVDVHIVDNEQLETVVRCLLRAFERFGGMPLKCVRQYDYSRRLTHH